MTLEDFIKPKVLSNFNRSDRMLERDFQQSFEQIDLRYDDALTYERAYHL